MSLLPANPRKQRTITSAWNCFKQKNYNFCLELFQAKELSLLLGIVSSKRTITSAWNCFKQKNYHFPLQLFQAKELSPLLAIISSKRTLKNSACNVLGLRMCISQWPWSSSSWGQFTNYCYSTWQQMLRNAYTHTNLTRNHCLSKQL